MPICGTGRGSPDHMPFAAVDQLRDQRVSPDGRSQQSACPQKLRQLQPNPPLCGGEPNLRRREQRRRQQLLPIVSNDQRRNIAGRSCSAIFIRPGIWRHQGECDNQHSRSPGRQCQKHMRTKSGHQERLPSPPLLRHHPDVADMRTESRSPHASSRRHADGLCGLTGCRDPRQPFRYNPPDYLESTCQ